MLKKRWKNVEKWKKCWKTGKKAWDSIQKSRNFSWDMNLFHKVHNITHFKQISLLFIDFYNIIYT